MKPAAKESASKHSADVGIPHFTSFSRSRRRSEGLKEPTARISQEIAARYPQETSERRAQNSGACVDGHGNSARERRNP